MEIPIQVAVRIFPCFPNELCRVETFPKYIDGNVNQCDVILANGYQPNIDNNDQNGVGLVQVTQSRPTKDDNGNAVHNEKSSFKIRHALPYGCSQEFIYRNTVQSMIRNFLEGYDVSIVTYGQCCTGKTYCMYGPGFDQVYNELEQGIVPRAICDIFNQLTKRPRGCRFSVNVAWIELNGNDIHDILGDGIIQCNSLNDAFQCLRIGFVNRNPEAAHNIFTITIEQQWINSDGLLQHRLSTASFCDLMGTQRMATVNQYDEAIGMPKDPGLQVLERIVISLCDPDMLENDRNSLMNQYEDTMLTRLLKDSFGGRAQTLLICCVSPLQQDISETIENLHFAYKTQFVRNAVILNTYSDNNMPIANFIDPTVIIDPRLTKYPPYNPADMINKLNTSAQNAPAMEFAATQWIKLIAKAEGLFTKLLVNNKMLNDDDRECIEEWMYLKQECESFSSAGLISNSRLLKPIQEMDEHSEIEDGSHAELLEQEKTDLSGQNGTFSENESDDDENLEQLEAKVSELMLNFSCKVNEIIEDNYKEFVEAYPKAVMNSYEDKPQDLAVVAVANSTAVGVTSRRRSIPLGESSGLSSSDLEHLNRIAEEGLQNSQQQLCLNNTVCREALAFLENSDHMHPLRMASRHKSEEAISNGIRRVKNDIKAKETEISELKQYIRKKRELIDELIESNGDRVKAKRELNRTVTTLQTQKVRCNKMIANGREKKLPREDIDKLKNELLDIEKQLNEKCRLKEISRYSDNTIKGYQQDVDEREKKLTTLMKTLKKDRKLLREFEGKLKMEKSRMAKEEKRSTARVNVDTRITQLDCVLKEKSEYLSRNNDESELVQSIRHEIRNLRSQRDRLTDAQCCLNQKPKWELTQREERKLLEYDVAKEVIDHAMEMKNQLICGRDVLSNPNFFGNKDLMNQLDKLNEKEMRVLLYKCFQKIVDLRESTYQMEQQLLQFEKVRIDWELRERAMYNEFQQIRLEEERYTLDLQKQYETTLTMLLQKAGENCGTTSSIPNNALMLPSPLQLIHSRNRHHHHQRHAISNEIGFGIHDYNGSGQQQRHDYRFSNALATTSKREDTEPMDVFNKQKQKFNKNFFRLFSSSSGMKHNLHPQLMLPIQATQNPTTSEGKVTVVKKKIIIQQNKS